MNERIKELAIEARTYAVEFVKQSGDPMMLEYAHTSKFAELIIQECADFLTDDLDYPDAALKLMEKFGVEE